MNEKIIQRLKDSLDYEFELSFNERKQLLDYIINLQEKNERYKTANSTLNEVVTFMYNQAKNYKLKKDKAIEYIEEHTDKLRITRIPKIDFNYNDLLNILYGDLNER